MVPVNTSTETLDYLFRVLIQQLIGLCRLFDRKTVRDETRQVFHWRIISHATSKRRIFVHRPSNSGAMLLTWLLIRRIRLRWKLPPRFSVARLLPVAGPGDDLNVETH